MHPNNFLEFLAIYLGIIDLVGLFVFARYLLDEWPHWWDEPYRRMAVGFAVYFAGTSIVRLWEWTTTFGEKHHVYTPPQPGTILYQTRPVFTLGTIITTAGLICILRQVSVWKSNWVWAIIMIAAGVVAGLMAWLT